MHNLSSEILFTIVLGSILFIGLGTFIIVFLLQYIKRKYNHQQELLRLQQSTRQIILQSKLEIQEQTLQHVSYELHDNISQIASLIKINLNTLDFRDLEKVISKIEDTKEITRQLIMDIKNLSVSLGSDRIARSGLVKALEIEIERLNKSEAFDVSFTQQGSIPQLDNDKSVILYRMSQEILNNMIKHSGAKHLLIDLRVTEKLFILEFNDDGIGFDIEEKKQNGGAGLFNLENRAKLINAHLVIESTPDKGTRVSIELPV